jgi:hypothetical protein
VAISPAISAGVVRGVPSTQRPSSAAAYTLLTSAASWLTSMVSPAVAAGAIRTSIMSRSRSCSERGEDIIGRGDLA